MIRLIALVAIAAIALAGCGARKEQTAPGAARSLNVAMSPLDTGEGAVYAAQAGGQFKGAGLAVRMSQSPDPAAAIRQVQQGRADLAVTTEPDLLEARGRGARVVSVAALVQSPFSSLIGPGLSARSVLALATKPIGTQGIDYQRAFAETIFKEAHVVDVGSDLSAALQSKKVAAVIAPFGGPSLPPGVSPIPVDRVGVPTFSEYVVVANEEAIGRDGDEIRAFIGALARGTRDLAAVKRGRLGAALGGPEAARIRALMLPPSGRPYGWQEPARWRAFAAWMRAHKLPQRGSTGAFTNDLLPGQGL